MTEETVAQAPKFPSNPILLSQLTALLRQQMALGQIRTMPAETKIRQAVAILLGNP